MGLLTSTSFAHKNPLRIERWRVPDENDNDGFCKFKFWSLNGTTDIAAYLPIENLCISFGRRFR
jgi:hypothetical protein